jgi:hypothetical protein
MKLKLVLVGILASMAAIVGGTLLTVYFTHPRDDAGYLTSLHDSGTGQAWRKAFSTQTDGYFLLQAEDACGWLDDQGMALWRTSDWYQLSSLTKRYGLTADEQDQDLWGSMPDARKARALIAEHAFENICGATYELHRPHHLWRDASAD